MSVPKPCPCGSQQPYADCCEPYLTGKAIAPTAEALMRSRYTAYCKQNLDYLLQTRHPDHHFPDEAPAIRRTFQSTHWVSLTIVKTHKGQSTDRKGTVEFIARYQEKKPNALLPNPQVQAMQERSSFVKVKEHWLYTVGK